MSKQGEEYIASKEKRAFDVTSAAIVGGLAVPAMGVAAVALCAERRKINPFLIQKRVAMHGNYFQLHKLRTLPEVLGDEVLETYGSIDPRASKFGRMIRHLGLDELPQTINVLNGEMHMVGIRPQVDSVLEDRRVVDPKLFDDWYYCYQRNLGLFGNGQAYAHTIGRYSEGDELIIEVMKRDVAGFESASLGSDISCVFGSTIGLLTATAQGIRQNSYSSSQIA